MFSLVDSKEAHKKEISRVDFSQEKPNFFFTTDGDELSLWDLRNLDKRLISFSQGNFCDAQFFMSSNINILYADYHKIHVLNLYK